MTQCKVVRTDVALLMIQAINELREEEGSSVEILSDNVDAADQPNCAVICNGDWTMWEDQRFGGDTLDQALAEALGTYREHKRKEEASA